MIEVKTDKGETHVKLCGSTKELIVNLSVMVAATLEAIIDGENKRRIDSICTDANLVLIAAVQHARKKVLERE